MNMVMSLVSVNNSYSRCSCEVSAKNNFCGLRAICLPDDFWYTPSCLPIHNLALAFNPKNIVEVVFPARRALHTVSLHFASQF